jgi:selenocysteine-specific elongation factor
MSFIIGTAGHIDHGKTSLVKALTGQDTDRLKEEKERGISIELGFAYLDLPDGTRAGVVDVPGHERFIRNMLAGAHGIDLVLFTVAADDGVMPQTEEHLDIVHLLGIRRAIVVITKADLVSDARVSEVEEDVNVLIAGTALEGASMIACSVVTGRGLDDLRSQIGQMLDAASRDDRATAASHDFRLPVDRVFLLQGHGLVVTGTALSGEIRTGDRVRRLPGQQVFRVRSVHVHNQPVDVARRGQRVALNLSGQEKPLIVRGDVIGDERITLTTDRFDARVEVRTTATSGLKSHQRVRVHLGTAERLGTVIVLGSDQTLMPKQSAFCQIALTEPVAAMRGDHFIIRDETAQRTLGGGVVVHPLARKHKRGEARLLERLDRLQHGSLAEAIDILLAESDEFALAIDPLRQLLNIDGVLLRTELERMRTVIACNLEGEALYSAETKWQRAKDALLLALHNHHAAQPLSPGMEMEAARDMVAAHTTPRLFRALVERLESERAVVRDGSLLRVPTHVVRLDDQERTLAERVTALVGHEPFAPPDLKQIEREVGIPSAKLSEVLRVMEREKSIVRVSPELYFLSGAIDKVKAALFGHLSGAKDITPATFRDLFGTTRKYAIPLLEYLDREGFTVRVGDTRRLKR